MNLGMPYGRTNCFRRPYFEIPPESLRAAAGVQLRPTLHESGLPTCQNRLDTLLSSFEDFPRDSPAARVLQSILNAHEKAAFDT